MGAPPGRVRARPGSARVKRDSAIRQPGRFRERAARYAGGVGQWSWFTKTLTSYPAPGI